MDILIATLQDLKTLRPDLCDQLYDEFMKTHPIQMSKKGGKKTKEDSDCENSVKIGDVLHWNYTKEEGVVIGFESSNGVQWIIVEHYDGLKIYFENDPKLFKKLEGEERDCVINKRKEFLKSQIEKESNKAIEKPKSAKKKKQYDENETYNVPTRRGSKLKIGDKIRYKMTHEIFKVIGFKKTDGLDRIVLKGSNKIPLTIIDNPSAYEII